MGMNNASDYLTGDDMIDYLIAGIDGVNPVRGALIDSNAFWGMDTRDMERAGLITVHYPSRFLTYALTDTGATLAASLH